MIKLVIRDKSKKNKKTKGNHKTHQTSKKTKSKKHSGIKFNKKSNISLKNAILFKTCYSLEDIPPFNPAIKEFVIGGRSNVGKSSLINKLLNINNVAYVSSKPGKTVSINFYKFFCKRDKYFFLVDLPGYGYAKVKKKQQYYWGTFIETFLKERDYDFFILLIDIRRGLQEEEKNMINFFQLYNIDFIVVFTKIDEINNNQLSEFKKKLAYDVALLWKGDPKITEKFNKAFFTSSKKGEGIKELRNFLKKNAMC